MHSKILQVERKPIERTGFIRQWDIPRRFVEEIADYVDDVPISYVPELAQIVFYRNDIFSLDTEKMTVTIKDKMKYFEEMLEEFKIRLANLTEKVTLEAFSCLAWYSGLDYELAACNCAYNDKYGFYICESRDDYPITFDEWMRSVKDGDTFYIGGAIDYHF